ncbi:DUF2085 domain-containing protein [candidate division WOR-3 bacterium]|nr:DUF2085 domain-containing protein [candidate division WOR-3 bacterium]
MKFFEADRKKYPLWALSFSTLFLLVWLLGVVPAFLDSCGLQAGSLKIRIFYKVLCHGLPERCPHYFGQPAAVCFRCTGIDLGFFFTGAVFYPLLRRYLDPGIWPVHLALITVFSVFIFLEWIAELLGFISSSWILQYSTGMLFSTGISIFLFSIAENVIETYCD